ncbi:hypothetical protein [Streptomyces sp. NPDC008121]
MNVTADSVSLSYKGLDGVPTWVLLIVVVLVLVWMAVSRRRRDKS